MFGLVFRRILSGVVTLTLALSPCLIYAAPHQDRVGMLVQFGWNMGDVHPDQSRWQANFALGSTDNIIRSVYKNASIGSSFDDSFDYDYLAGYYHERSLLPLQWSTDSLGSSLGMLYGFPVVIRLSPVFNASESSAGSGIAIASNPWVWVGVAVVGLAAAAGGSGGGSSSGGIGSGGGTEVNVASGVGGEECDVVSGEDATSVELVSGCGTPAG
jgi:hypothetical protein